MGAIVSAVIVNKDSGALPALEGTVSFPEAQADKISIHRDSAGVPHIVAQSLADAVAALGFVHAQDRMWQMDMSRRAAYGRLSELVGDVAVDSDRFSRALGWARLAERDWDKIQKTDPELTKILESYASGINRYIENQAVFPVEFQLLGYRPEPWKPVDSLGIIRVMAFKMSFGWQHMLVRLRLIQAVGLEHSKVFEIKDQEVAPIVSDIDWASLDLSSVMDPAVVGAGPEADHGSNFWAVHGSRTASGKPLFCNDPHLPVSVPGVFYEAHMIIEDEKDPLNVSGASIAGAPGIVAGHNQWIGFGVTLSYVDVDDLFVEKIKETDEDYLYERDGEWVKADVTVELIKVKGKADPVYYEVISTCHGPIISGVLGVYEKGVTKEIASEHKLETSELRFSYCSGSMKDRDDIILRGFLNLQRAKNFDEFRSALKEVSSPSLSYGFASVSGDIGYTCTGRAPIRSSDANAMLPAIGWKSENDWKGEVSGEEMPWSLNPKDGFVVSANHRIIKTKSAGGGYKYYLGDIYRPGFRATVIRNELLKLEKATLDDMKKIQGNIYTIPGERLQKVFQDFKLEESDPKLEEILSTLKNWNLLCDVDSAGTTVFAVLFWKIANAVILSGVKGRFGTGQEALEIEENHVKQLWGAGFHPVVKPFQPYICRLQDSILRILEGEDDWWLEQSGGKQLLLTKCLKETSVFLERKFGSGSTSSEWKWGELHKYSGSHPMSRKLGPRPFNTWPPVPSPGENATVAVSSWNSDGSFDASQNVGVSWRMVSDLADWDKSESQVAPGQSGQVSSRFYQDRVKDWSTMIYHPMPFSKEKVLSTADLLSLTLDKSAAPAPTGGCTIL